MSVRFNDVEIQNPQLDNTLVMAKSQRILQPAGGGPVYVHDLSATLYLLELPFRGLRDAEKDALETFFETTVEGCRQRFLYLDHRGEPWLAHFAQDRLDFRCVDDEVASSGTFSSGGSDYPTTTREESVWNLDVELEAVYLPLSLDYHLNDVSAEWDSISCSPGVGHGYNALAAYEGARGSLLTIQQGGSGKYGQLKVDDLNYVAFYMVWHMNFDGLTMAAGDDFQSCWCSNRWRLDAKNEAGTFKYRVAIYVDSAWDFTDYLATPSGWVMIEILFVYPSYSGAGDFVGIFFVNGSQIKDCSGATPYGTKVSNYRLGICSGADANTYGLLKVDKSVVYGF